jgi:hypothetical protein
MPPRHRIETLLDLWNDLVYRRQFSGPGQIGSIVTEKLMLCSHSISGANSGNRRPVDFGGKRKYNVATLTPTGQTILSGLDRSFYKRYAHI